MTNSKEDDVNGAVQILKRDNWTCQVCGYMVKEDSDERMFATLVGSDPTNPSDVEARCRSCHEIYLEKNQGNKSISQGKDVLAAEDTDQPEYRLVEAQKILNRDNTTCQLCGHTPPKGSDESMHVVQIGEDETNPDHFETRCSEHRSRGDWESYQEKHRYQFQFFAMLMFLFGAFFGVFFIVTGLSILNPLRIVGMSTWPAELYGDINAITVDLYLRQVAFHAPQALILGSIILVVTTQLTIWYEAKNGWITRLTKWVIGRVKNIL